MKRVVLATALMTVSPAVLAAQDGFEPDDSFGQARTVVDTASAINLTPEVHSMDPAGDNDYFAIILDGDFDVVIETSGDPADDTNLWLSLGPGQGIEFDLNSGPDNHARIDRCLGPGTYYSWAYESLNDDIVAAYTITITTTPTTCGDAYEDDDVLIDARTVVDTVTSTNLTPETHTIDPVMDEDWFGIVLDDDYGVTVASSIADFNELRFRLRDSGGNEIESASSSSEPVVVDRLCGVDPLPAGTYYLQADIIDPSGTPPTTYDITITTGLCTGTVSGHLFEDTNGNGVEDAGEPGVAGVDVLITDDRGSMQTSTSDPSGDYSASAPTGSTTVDVDESTLPTGFVQTAGTDPTVVTVPDGGIASDLDGYQAQGTVSGHLFEDTDGDGVEDAGEPDLAGIDVVISDSQSGIQTLTSDATGDYSATVSAGSTTVDVDESTLPAGSVQTAGTDPTVVGVPAGGTANDLDGFQPQGTVSGHVFEDSNGNGLQDAGELDLAGVLVDIDESHGGLQTEATDGAGDFSAQVPAGATTVTVDESTLPAAAQVQLTAGSNPAAIDVVAGEDNLVDPFGYRLLSLVEIPTLGGLGLLLLALGLGLGGIKRIRK